MGDRLSSDKVVVAVPHMNVDVGVKEYLRNVDGLLLNSKERGAHIVLLPSPLHPLIDTLRGVRKFSTYESALSELINKLITLSNKFFLYIILSPVIHRAGSRRYLASVILSPQGSTYFIKKILSDNYTQLIDQGREVELADIGNFKLCPIIGTDICIPEIPRLCSHLGADLIVSIQLPNITSVKGDVLKSIVVTRALENSIPVVSVGGYTSEEFLLIPTIVTNSAGEVVEVGSSFEVSIFIIEVVKRNVIIDEDFVKSLKQIIKKYVR